MPCYHPLLAYETTGGSISFFPHGSEGKSNNYKPPDLKREIKLPCNRCIGCRIDYSRRWSIRCMHEAAMHESNMFVTLTYNDDHLPENGSLNYRDFQLFCKKVRKAHGSFRFYMCGEYGEKYSRPHYHACIFGLRFADLYYWRLSAAGYKLFRSPELERLWANGNCEVGEVTAQSAGYVARYVMKKVFGPRAKDHYKTVDPDTGEIFDRVPEFARMSLKPGIGRPWYDKYKSEVFPRDRVVVNGREVKPPSYYKRIYDLSEDLRSDYVDASRAAKVASLADDNTEARLLVREKVATAKLRQLKRGDS